MLQFHWLDGKNTHFASYPHLAPCSETVFMENPIRLGMHYTIGKVQSVIPTRSFGHKQVWKNLTQV